MRQGSWPVLIAHGFAMAVACFFCAELGHLVSLPGSFASFWLPAGLVIAVLATAEPARWPILIAGTFVANLSSDVLFHDKTVLVSFGFWISNTFEVLFSVWLLRSFLPVPFRLDSVRRVALFVVLSGLLAPMIGATFGGAVVSNAFDAPYGSSWLKWYLSDVIGVLGFAPIALAVIAEFRRRDSTDQKNEDAGRELLWFSSEDAGSLLVVMCRVPSIAVLTYLFCRLGNTTFQPELDAPLIFPAAGFAICAVFVMGNNAIAGVAAGTLLFELQIGRELPEAAGFVVAASLEALLARFCIRRFFGDRVFGDSGNVIRFFVSAGGLSALAGSLIRCASLCLAGDRAWADFPQLLQSWVGATSVGILTVTPLLLVGRLRGQWDDLIRRRIEFCNIVLVSVVSGTLVFGNAGNLPFAFLPIVVVLWAAQRFGQRGAVLINCFFAFFVSWGTISGLGPFGARSPEMAAFVMQTFVAITSLTGLILATEVLGKHEFAAQADLLQEATDKLSETNKRFDLAVQGANDGLWDWDVATGEVWYSPRFRELLGYECNDLENIPNVYKSFESRLHPDDLKPTNERIRAHLESDEPYDVEYRLKLRDDSYRWFRARGASVRDDSGKPTRMSGSIRDIHEELEAERFLAKQTKELEASNAELEQFAYVASHDLQEPLRAVAGYVQLLEMDYAESFDDVAKEYMTHTVEGVVRMQTLIHDLLEYSRVMRKADGFKPVDLSDSLASARALLELPIKESEAVIEADDLPIVMADSSQMTRLLQNLISNSIKYRSEEAPRITITTEKNTESGGWTIRFHDNGIGIEPKFAERIFVIFQRLHTRNEYPGTGLGLAVCRRILERHGGTIYLDPENKAGTMFVLTLPFEPENDGSTHSLSADRSFNA